MVMLHTRTCEDAGIRVSTEQEPRRCWLRFFDLLNLQIDKWRNVNGGGGGSGGRRKARTSHPPVMPEPCRISLDKRIAKYNTMIYESLKYIENPNGTDLDTMINFLKVNDLYKVMGTSSGAETSRQEDVRTNLVDTQEHPASVAIKVALAEINEYEVTKLCEDKNKLDELLDESVAMLMLAEGLHEQCKKYGSVTLRPYSAV